MLRNNKEKAESISTSYCTHLLYQRKWSLSWKRPNRRHKERISHTPLPPQEREDLLPTPTPCLQTTPGSEHTSVLRAQINHRLFPGMWVPTVSQVQVRRPRLWSSTGADIPRQTHCLGPYTHNRRVTESSRILYLNSRLKYFAHYYF